MSASPLPLARDVEGLQARLASVPYARFLGFDVTRDARGLVGCLPFRESLIGNPRIRAIHGGALGALLELTALCELMTLPEIRRLPKIVTVTVEYLRGTRDASLYARADVIRHGRRLASVRAYAWQDDPDRWVASASTLFLLSD